MRLVSGVVPQGQETSEEILLPQAMPKALLFFLRRRSREGNREDFSLREICPEIPLSIQRKVTFKLLILKTPLSVDIYCRLRVPTHVR